MVRALSRKGRLLGTTTIYLQRLIEIHHGHNQIGHYVIFVFRKHGQLGDHLWEPVVWRGHVQPVSDIQEVLCDRQTRKLVGKTENGWQVIFIFFRYIHVLWLHHGLSEKNNYKTSIGERFNQFRTTGFSRLSLLSTTTRLSARSGR